MSKLFGVFILGCVIIFIFIASVSVANREICHDHTQVNGGVTIMQSGSADTVEHIWNPNLDTDSQTGGPFPYPGDKRNITTQEMVRLIMKNCNLDNMS